MYHFVHSQEAFCRWQAAQRSAEKAELLDEKTKLLGQMEAKVGRAPRLVLVYLSDVCELKRACVDSVL